LPRTRTINFCFHGVGTPERELEPGEYAYWISLEFFHEILDYAMLSPAVRLSFDDGNASDVEVVLPALRDRGLSASFFPIAGRIDAPGCVARAGLRALVDHGMTIGSHGMNHRQWAGLGNAELEDELVCARNIIARDAGTSVDTAACPLGSYDRRILKRLRRLGYTRVFTSDRSVAHPSAWLQPRYSIRRDDSLNDVRDLVEQPRPLIVRMTSRARMTAKRLR
jgi:peptidoglycan/xylan/chitin deacetylase (PgdA/CDA1 family)